MIGLLLLAFVAGILTVLAPCVIPILPVIIGSATSEKQWKKPLTIILSLAVSIFVFSLALKLLADSVGFNPRDLTFLTIFVLIVYGLILLFPSVWDRISIKLGLARKSDGLLDKFADRADTLGNVLVGFSLGPVFNSCSPTYLLVILPLLEQSLLEGILYLLVYLIGLVLILGLIAWFGYAFTKKVSWAYNPDGVFRKIMGLLFILIAIFILFEFDKQIETYLLANTDFYIELINLELNLQESAGL